MDSAPFATSAAETFVGEETPSSPPPKFTLAEGEKLRDDELDLFTKTTLWEGVEELLLDLLPVLLRLKPWSTTRV